MGGLFDCSIISARCDDVLLKTVTLGITDQDDRKHIHLFRIPSRQCRNGYGLFRTTRLTDKADGSLRLTVLEKQLFQAIELPIACLAFGIIDSCHEIGFGSRPNPSFDHLPRGHQIGQRNHTEIVPNGSSQQRGRLLKGTNPGQYFDLHPTVGSPFHLIDQRGHSIDTCITGTDHAHLSALLRIGECLFGPCLFPFHACIDTKGIGSHQRTDELKIIAVANHHISRLKHLTYGWCDL